MKRIICKSGIKGWQCNLQLIYSNYEEFCAYNKIYKIAQRLGFSSARTAWKKNPVIEGSTNPEDLSISA